MTTPFLLLVVSLAGLVLLGAMVRLRLLRHFTAALMCHAYYPHWRRRPWSCFVRHPSRWQGDPPTSARTVTNLTKTEAEQLLDWLEMQGWSNLGVSYDPEKGFTVQHQQRN